MEVFEYSLWHFISPDLKLLTRLPSQRRREAIRPVTSLWPYENNAQGMAIMARFKTHNSTYNGDGNRQKSHVGYFLLGQHCVHAGGE